MHRLLQKLKRRPFPTNAAALRNCRISHSQFGEDLCLSNLLGYEKNDGTYVDIGCYHPIIYSNTYIFYQRGWSGVAVDPNPAWRHLWRKYRPRDTFLNRAVSSQSGPASFYMNAEFPACNKIVPGPDALTAEEKRAGKCVSVKCTTMAGIFESTLGNRRVDLLNIDCEGHDLEVLKTHDFTRWRPTVVAVEDTDVHLHTEVAALLIGCGYKCEAHIGLTKIFKLLS